MRIALWVLLAYLSLSESLNQTIGSSPHNLMLLAQTVPGYFSSLSHSCPLLPALKIPKHGNTDGPQSLRSTARIYENKIVHQDNKKIHHLIYFLLLPKLLHFFVTVISAKIVLYTTKTFLLLITLHFDSHSFQYARGKV